MSAPIMTIKMAVQLLMVEKACLQKQIASPCEKEDCSACKLAQQDTDLLAMYDLAIRAMLMLDNRAEQQQPPQNIRDSFQWLVKLCNAFTEAEKSGDKIGFTNIKAMHDHVLDIMNLLLNYPTGPKVLPGYAFDTMPKETPVWTEFPSGECHADIFCGANDTYVCFAQYYEHGARSNHRNEYGRTWRCWDERPTDQQRKEAKWDE